MEKSSRLTTEQRANLVAYLDGELDEASQREIEQALASNPVARHEIEMLQSTWELLDELPRTTASAEFTERTLASIQAQRQPAPLAAAAWVERVKPYLGRAAWAAGLAAAVVLGFLAAYRWIPTPTDQLLAELPLIQNLSIYQEVGDAEFIRELRQTGLFEGEDPLEVLPGGITNEPGTLAARRERIERMSLADKEALRRNFEAYRNLPPAERVRYQRLHSELEEDVQTGARLATTLAAYRDWLEGLYQRDRKAIREEPNPELRIKLIEEIHERDADDERLDVDTEQLLRDLGPPRRMAALGDEDRDAVLEVIARTVELSKGEERRLANAPDVEKNLHILVAALRQHRTAARETQDRWPDEELAEEMIEAIRDPAIREFLAQRPNPEVRRSIVGLLTLRKVMQDSEQELARRAPSERELAQLAESLEPEFRARLDELDETARRRELMRMYFAEHRDPFVRDLRALQGLRRQILPREERPGMRGPGIDGGPPRRPPEDKPRERRPRERTPSPGF